jgi:PAS domain S-box-containing protein
MGMKLTKKAIDTGERQEMYELEVVHKTGKKVRIEVREFPVIKDVKTIAIVGALTDISDRKQAEKALKDSEKRYNLCYGCNKQWDMGLEC